MKTLIALFLLPATVMAAINLGQYKLVTAAFGKNGATGEGDTLNAAQVFAALTTSPGSTGHKVVGETVTASGDTQNFGLDCSQDSCAISIVQPVSSGQPTANGISFRGLVARDIFVALGNVTPSNDGVNATRTVANLSCFHNLELDFYGCSLNSVQIFTINLAQAVSTGGLSEQMAEAIVAKFFPKVRAPKKDRT